MNSRRLMSLPPRLKDHAAFDARIAYLAPDCASHHILRSKPMTLLAIASVKRRRLIMVRYRGIPVLG